MTDVVNKSSADESEEKQRTLSLTENSPTSGGIESEYDTASTNSRSDNEQDEYEDSEEEDSIDDEEVTDDEKEAVDDERESGDGQEELESEGGSKKKVDHDEDRSNPQYIPKKGTFYEHDDRMAEDIAEEEKAENSDATKNSTEGLSTSGKVLSTQNQKVTPKSVKKAKDTDCWTHDRFNEHEQAPKSRSELVSAYGYDIRTEDGPPRPRRQRRYGRNQLKYSRNWEDEEAYKKSQSLAKPRRPLRPEDFPALGSTTSATPKSSKSNRDGQMRRNRNKLQDENDPQTSSLNYRSPVRSRDQRLQRDDRERRDSREQRNQRYNNDTASNNNNARYVKGKKNINFNHNIEFKNQNRKNINYESSQTKNNNVLNQMQSSSSHQHGQSQQPQQHRQQHQQQHQQQQQSNSSHHHQSNQRYNNNEPPLPTLSFTNSKMNNATNNNNNNNNSNNAVPATSSRGILNYDNSSSNYGRGSREKEVNSQQQQQMQQQAIHNQAQAMSPNKNIQQYNDQMDQIKLMEKNYQQQQGKATNLNLNQIPPQQQQQNNMNNMQQDNMADMSRSKRYSSLKQRSNLNEASSPQQQPSQQQQSQPPVQQYHPQFHPQQEIDPSHVQIPSQQTQAYMPPPPQQSQATPANIMAPPPATQANVQQQQQQPPQVQKYQAAYYAANPASEYAIMQAAMVEKYQYQQQTTPTQYMPPQPAQPIYMPSQTQPTQQQQILNYVSTIQPQAPAGAPAYSQYTNYQNYNIQAPAAQTVPQTQPPTPAQNASIYQTQSGLTYFPNAPIAPAHQQRIIQPQRRPNPIPILAPPDHKIKSNATSSGGGNDDGEKNSEADKAAENIDHILDNMFVQRPMTNIVSLKDSAPPASMTSNSVDDRNDEQINESMNTMSIDDKKGAD